MDQNTQFIIAKLAALEQLMHALFLIEFERAASPMSAVNEMSERVLDSAAKNRGATQSPVAVEAGENVNLFFDAVRTSLRQRGHQ